VSRKRLQHLYLLAGNITVLHDAASWPFKHPGDDSDAAECP
jgi:hypothetical protein